MLQLILLPFYFNFILLVLTGQANFYFNQCSIFRMFILLALKKAQIGKIPAPQISIT